MFLEWGSPSHYFVKENNPENRVAEIEGGTDAALPRRLT